MSPFINLLFKNPQLLQNNIYAFVRECMFFCVHMYVCMYVCVCVCVCVCVYMYVNVCMCVFMLSEWVFTGGKRNKSICFWEGRKVKIKIKWLSTTAFEQKLTLGVYLFITLYVICRCTICLRRLILSWNSWKVWRKDTDKTKLPSTLISQTLAFCM